MEFVGEMLKWFWALAMLAFAILVFRRLFPRGKHWWANEADDESTRQRLCAECGYDLRATPNRCPECGARPHERAEYFRRLRTEWPADPIKPRKPQADEQVILVRSTWVQIEARLLVDQLNARGVPAAIRGEEQSWMPYQRAPMTVYHVVAYSGDTEFVAAFMDRMNAQSTDSRTPPDHEVKV